MLLATEHARLEGDGAEHFAVARFGVAAIPSSDPVLKEMLTQRIGIERDLASVKERRAMLQRRIDVHRTSLGESDQNE